jgi:formamidopyrimidine-DNA glycosylase
MPELPDLQVYLDALAPRVLGQPLERAVVANPFVLRTVDPPLAALLGRPVASLGRLGKRLLFRFGEGGDEIVLAIHLMIAGRLRWRATGGKAPPKKMVLAELGFPTGWLVLTEAGTTRRAAIHVVRPTASPRSTAAAPSRSASRSTSSGSASRARTAR